MLGPDFITVNRDSSQVDDWEILKPQIFAAINDFYLSNLPVILKKNNSCDEPGTATPDSEVVEAIKELLDSKIRF